MAMMAFMVFISSRAVWFPVYARGVIMPYDLVLAVRIDSSTINSLLVVVYEQHFSVVRPSRIVLLLLSFVE